MDHEQNMSGRRRDDPYNRNRYSEREFQDNDRSIRNDHERHRSSQQYSRQQDQDKYGRGGHDSFQRQEYDESRHRGRRDYDQDRQHDERQRDDGRRSRRRRHEEPEPEPERAPQKSRQTEEDRTWDKARQKAKLEGDDDEEPSEETVQFYYDEMIQKERPKKKKKKEKAAAPFERGDKVLVTDEDGEWPAVVHKYMAKSNMVLVKFEDPTYGSERVDASRVRKADSHAKQAPREQPEPEEPAPRRDSVKKSRPKESSHNYRIGQNVEAMFDPNEAEPWLPAIVKAVNPLKVIWVGYEDEEPQEIDLKEIRKVAEKIEVGDKVVAPYEGERFPGVVDSITDKGAYINFEGYEDYEPYLVPMEDVQLKEKGNGESGAVANHDNEGAAELNEDDPNWRPPPPEIRFANRDAVWFFPEGEEPRRPEVLGVRGQGEWENAVKCWVKGYDEYSQCYDLQTADRERQRHRHIPAERLRMCGSAQDQAKCVFAYLKKKLIPKNEFVDTYRMFFWKGGNPDRCRTNRDEQHIFNEVYPGDYKEMPDETWMMWKEEIPLPEMPWWCPPVWDLPYARLASVEEDGETRRGRIKGYCPFTKLYYLVIRNGENKECFKFPVEKLTLCKTKQERCRELFGFYGKRVLSKRMFEGLWRYAIENDRRPPDLEKICEDNDVVWDEVSCIDNYGIKYVGPDFPKFPEGKGPDGKTDLKAMREDIPKMFPFDFFSVDGSDIREECTSQGFEDPTGLSGRGRINQDGSRTDNQYQCNIRFKQYDADREAAPEFECDVWIPEEKLERQMRMNDKAEIIFGAFGSVEITEADFKLTLHRFFKDRVMNVKRACDSAELVEFDDETRMVAWEPGAEDMPGRPDNPLWQNPPRKWKDGAKAQFRTNEYEIWRNCNVEKEVDYGSGMYIVTDRDDQQKTVDCIHIRPLIMFVDKVRAVFADEQQAQLHMDVVNAGINNKFGENIPSQEYEVYMKLGDRLEDSGFDIDHELHTLTITDGKCPPKNLMQLWQLKETLSFRQRIDQTFLMNAPEDPEAEFSMTCEEFNEKFEEIFDDRISDFNRTFEDSDKYQLDGEKIIVTDRSRLGGNMDDTTSWKEKFEGREINWATEMQNQDFVKRLTQMYKADQEASEREMGELNNFWANHQVTYHSDRGEEAEKELANFPRPAYTFEEAFQRYKDDPDVGHVVGQIIAQLNKNFKEPTPIQKCCWPAIFSDRDILGISKTGSGKTLTFGLPIIIKVTKQKAMANSSSFGSFCHALIVVPTRELASQHVSALQPYCEMANVKIVALYGGNRNFREQVASIEAGVDIVVATVGRLLHFLNDDILSLKNTTFIILDEADEMLVGFEEAVREVLCNQVRPCLERQSLLFSATYADEVMELEHGFYENDPLRICVGSKSIMADNNVTQLFAQTNGYRENQDALIHCLEHIIQSNSKAKVLVFCNGKRDCDELNGDFMDMRDQSKSELIRHAVWHGEIEQQMREANLQSLKSGQINVILCTDVASRGIDIDDLTVVQYGFPGSRNTDREDGRERYIHRLGRSGRALKTGTCYVIDSRTPENWGDELIEILTDVEQVGPPLLYERTGTSAPCEEEQLPVDLPEWAGGPAKADLGVYAEPDDDDEDALSYKTLNLFGKDNQLAQCLKHFNPGFQGSSRISLDQLHDEATKAGLLVQIFEGGTGWEQYGDVELYGEEGGTEVFLMHCVGAMTLSNTEHFRPLLLYKDWQNAIRARRGKKVRKARVISKSAPQGDVIVHKDWTGKRANVFWEEDNKNYPATVNSYVDDDTVNVTFDDETFGTCDVLISTLSILGDKVLAAVQQSDKVGMKVTAQYPDDGEWYAATIKEDFQNGMYTVEFDLGGENDLDAAQIQFPAEEAAPAAVAEGTKCEVEYESEFFPATATDNGDGTYTVTFDDAEYGVEEAVGLDRIKFAEVAAAAGVKCEIEFEGAYYPASAADNGDGTYTVTYDDAAYGIEEAVGADRLKFSEAVVCQVEFEGAYYQCAATDNGDGTYYVTYEDEGYGAEDACPAERIKLPEKAAAASAGTKCEFEFEGACYPGTATDNGDGTYYFTYDDETYGVEAAAPADKIKLPGSAAPASSASAKKVTVEHEGEWYGASLKSDNEDGTFTIIYDDEAFGEAVVETARVKFSEAAASGEAAVASKFSVGPVQAWFGGDDGSYLPAQITRIDGEGYWVTFDGFEADGETCLQDDSVKAMEAAEPASAAEQKYSNGPASIYYPDEDSWMPGMIHSFSDGLYEVTYDGFEEVHSFPEDHIQNQKASSGAKEIASPTFTYSVAEAGLEAAYAADGEYYAIDITAQNEDGSYQVLYTEYAEDATVMENQIRRAEAVAAGAPDAKIESSAAPAFAYSMGESGLEGFYADDGNYYVVDITAQNEDGSYQVLYTEYGEDATLTEDQIRRASADAVPQDQPIFAYSVGEKGLQGLYADDGNYYAITITAQNDDGTYQIVYTEYQEEGTLAADQIQRSQAVQGDSNPPSIAPEVAKPMENEACSEAEPKSVEAKEPSDVEPAKKSMETEACSEIEPIEAIEPSDAEPTKAAQKMQFSVGEANLEGKYEGDFYAIDILSVSPENGTYHVTFPEYNEEADLTIEQIRQAAALGSQSQEFSVGEEGVEGLYADDEYGEEATLSADQIQGASLATDHSEAVEEWQPEQAGVEGRYGDGWFTIRVISNNGDNTYTISYIDYPEEGEVTLPGTDIRHAV